MVNNRNRLRDEARLRWEGEGCLAARRILPHALSSDIAAALISYAYVSTTQGNYQRLWETFQAYCTQNSLVSIPATTATICAYLGYIYDRGSVRGGSIRPYIAAIAAKHRTLGLSYPTTSGQVSQTRRGFRARDAGRNYGPPQRSSPLPTCVASYALTQAFASMENEDFLGLRRFGLLALTFLLCARPGSTRELQAQDVDPHPEVVAVQMRRVKYAETGVVPRIAMRIPLTSLSDPIRMLLRFFSSLAPPSGYLFPDRSNLNAASPAFLAQAVSTAFTATAPRAPVGLKFTPRSHRSRGISAAYATGLSFELIMRLSNHSDRKVVLRHYLDPKTPASDEGRLFFGRFLVHGN